MSIKKYGEGEGEQKFELEEIKKGEMERGQIVTLNPKVSAALKNVPKWIRKDIEAGIKPTLTSAVKEKGTILGFFSFIFHAITQASLWRLSPDVIHVKSNKITEKEVTEEVAARVLNLNVAVRNEKLSTLDPKELFSHHEKVSQEIRRLESLTEFEGYSILSEQVLKEARDDEIKRLKEHKQEIQREFDAKANKALEELKQGIPNNVGEAKKKLDAFDSNFPNLQRAQELKHTAMLQEQNKLKELQKREEMIPVEIEKLKERIEKAREEHIAPAIKRFEASLDQPNKQLEDLRAKQNRIAELEKKQSAIKEGKQKKEGWFGVLTLKEKSEYDELKKEEVPNSGRIKDLEMSIQEEKKTHESDLIELGKEYLQPLEKQINVLKEEQSTLSEKIRDQKLMYKRAMEESEQANNRLAEAGKEMLAYQKLLDKGLEVVEVRLKNYARAVAFREGMKMEKWTPNLAIQPPEIAKAVSEGLQGLDLPEIDPSKYLKK